jgi:hypothetical protein
MKSPVASWFVVARVALASAALTGFAETAHAAEETGVSERAPPDQSNICSARIARLEAILQRTRAAGRVAGSATESLTALLHRQPTPQSVARASEDAEKHASATLAQARKLSTEGKEAECVLMLEKVSPAALAVSRPR